MPTVHLSDRAVIDIAGADAEHFLQNVLTNDYNALRPGEARPGALLTPQGKILFDYLVSRTGKDAFRLECAAAGADELVKRLMLYRMRAKADISKRKQDVVAVCWGSKLPEGGVKDARFPVGITVRRYYDSPPVADSTEDAWHRLRIAYGIAESGHDYASGEAFPHEVLFDQNGGVGLAKGCYVGQEVVSRMHHRGTARRRLLIAKGNIPLPPSGTPVMASGRPLGTLGTVRGKDGLAIVRIDRVKEATDTDVPILAGETAVELSIPQWTDFDFPTTPAEAGEA